MKILRLALVTVAGWAVALSATAATFSFEFAYDGGGIPQIPGLVELVTNDFVVADIRVPTQTKIEIYRLEQADPAIVGRYLGGPDSDVDLLVGEGRFDLVQQDFDLAGQLIGTVLFGGSFFDELGLVFVDPDFGDVATYYATLPFRFFVDDTATYDGLPFSSMTGFSDVVWFTLPGENGLYRLQAAATVPEPSTWAMMIPGFGLAGAAMRRRRLPVAA